MSAKHLRRQFMRQFAGMTKYRRSVAWIIVAAYGAEILGSIALGHYLLSLPLSVLTGLGMAAIALFIATRQRGLNNIVHECSHATFSRHLGDNAVLGSICASLILSCFRDYRDEHMTHHAHLGDYDKDLDLQALRDLRLHEPLSRKVILRHLTNPLLGRHLPYYLRVNLSARDGAAYQALKIALLVGAGLFALFDPKTALLFVVLPFAGLFTTLNYWTDCLDHAGISASSDDLDSSRNVLAPLPLRVLFFPRNDSFHLVHHLFPQIPARHLAESHKRLCDDPLYQSRPNAVHPFGNTATHHPKASQAPMT